MVPRLFRRVVSCVRSDDVQVVDRALYLFECPKFLEVMRIYSSMTYPIVVPAIRDIGKKHWVPRMVQTFVTLRSIVRQNNEAAYYSALGIDKYEEKTFVISIYELKRLNCDAKWAILNKKLKAEFSSFEEPKLPYMKDAMPKDFNSLYSDIYHRVDNEF